MMRNGCRYAGLCAAVVAAVVCGCAVGPDYVRPDVETPATFRGVDGWKVAEPADALLAGRWWMIFDDPVLNDLEEQVVVTNQNLVVAEAQFRQARALAGAARAALYPTVTLGASATRSMTSANTGGGRNVTASNLLLPASFSWELDLWGRIRRLIEAGTAAMEASAADLAAARLSVQAELASTYFQLRTIDAQKQSLDASILTLEKSLELTRNRYAAGVVSRTDTLQADNLLQSTRAASVDLELQRSQLEHAIALLLARPAGSFSLPLLPLAEGPPPIPAVLPSELLERRPDIAASERRMAAANAQIGVAKAAYFPTVSLGASIGLEASDFARWFAWPSRLWSLGAAASETVFDGGARSAQHDQALAAYDASVASYRQTVLTAFKEVEDNLAALRFLEREAKLQEDAVRSSRETVAITRNQYQAGIVGYLNVLSAQNVELTDQRTAIGILGRRMNAAVLLIKAAGGRWEGAPVHSSGPPLLRDGGS